MTPDGLLESVASFGWKFEQSKLGERDLTIADGAGTDVPSPGLAVQGFPGLAKLPHLAYARIPLDAHFFSMEGLDLFVEVNDVSESWGREWADIIMAFGSSQSVPLGQGFSVRQGTIIDTGDRLIRALWGSSAEPGLGVERPAPVAYEEQLLSLQARGS